MSTLHEVSTFLDNRYPAQYFEYSHNTEDNSITVSWEDGLATRVVEQALENKFPTTHKNIILNRSMSSAYEDAVFNWCNTQIGDDGYKMLDMSDPILYPYPVGSHKNKISCHKLMPWELPLEAFPYLTISHGGDIGGFRNYRITVINGELYVNGQPAKTGEEYYGLPSHAKNRFFLVSSPSFLQNVRLGAENKGLVQAEWVYEEYNKVYGVRFILNPEKLATNPNVTVGGKFIVAIGHPKR